MSNLMRYDGNVIGLESGERAKMERRKGRDYSPPPPDMVVRQVTAELPFTMEVVFEAEEGQEQREGMDY